MLDFSRLGALKGGSVVVVAVVNGVFCSKGRVPSLGELRSRLRLLWRERDRSLSTDVKLTARRESRTGEVSREETMESVVEAGAETGEDNLGT